MPAPEPTPAPKGVTFPAPAGATMARYEDGTVTTIRGEFFANVVGSHDLLSDAGEVLATVEVTDYDPGTDEEEPPPDEEEPPPDEEDTPPEEE